MMSDMVVAYLEGRQTAKWLGCEQGAVAEWDDIVQELSSGVLRHSQVKRQTTDFSNDPALRAPKAPKAKKSNVTSAISAAPAEGAVVLGLTSPPSLPALSAFDASIAALAEWFSSVPADGKQRIFTIHVPDRQVKIKREFAMRHFEDLCALCHLGTTSANGLETHAQTNTAASDIFDWLTTWCGFTDWVHILKAFKHLDLKVRSLEGDIEHATEALLERYFVPASDAAKVLLFDLEHNATDAGAATPRQILALIGHYLRPDVPIWTQYALEGTSYAWGVSGFAAGHAANIEDPALTVPIYWNAGSSTEKRLKICIKFDHQVLSKEPLARRLMRLALHLTGPGGASLAEMTPWSIAVRGALSNTLGVTPDDFASLQWVEAKDIAYCADSRQLPGIVDVNNEINNFDSAMGKVVWDLTKVQVSSTIRAMTPGDLQAGVDALWQKISPILDANLGTVQALLGDMLSPASEGLGALGIMRLGPRTVQLLQPGLIMMLVTAVALKRDRDVAALLSSKDMRVIALRFWGGPASMGRIARELVDGDDNEAVEDFLGKEMSEIVLLSQVSSPHGEVNRVSLAADRSGQDSFGAPRRAKLAVTNSRQFREAVKSGVIENVTSILEPELRLRGLAREENIFKVELTK